MKILITGGHGFLARNLKLLFEDKGYEIFAPSRTELDVRNYPDVRKYFNTHNPDAIIHTAIKGGRREYKDTYNDFIGNMAMFENIAEVAENRPFIIYGSGAEFDRRTDIKQANEIEIFNSYPIDLYGLAKNIIARKSLTKYKNINILRIFACFNYDEDDSRFIKTIISNIKMELPIHIHQNKEMDFFFINDLFSITEYAILNNNDGHLKNLNMVYNEKKTLFQIAELIKKLTNNKKSKIAIDKDSVSTSYSGNGHKLSKIIENNRHTLKLSGLQDGIIQTINKLL